MSTIFDVAVMGARWLRSGTGAAQNGLSVSMWLMMVLAGGTLKNAW